jgi:hypothetical protein
VQFEGSKQNRFYKAGIDLLSINNKASNFKTAKSFPTEVNIQQHLNTKSELNRISLTNDETQDNVEEVSAKQNGKDQSK